MAAIQVILFLFSSVLPLSLGDSVFEISQCDCHQGGAITATGSSPISTLTRGDSTLCEIDGSVNSVFPILPGIVTGITNNQTTFTGTVEQAFFTQDFVIEIQMEISGDIGDAGTLVEVRDPDNSNNAFFKVDYVLDAFGVSLNYVFAVASGANTLNLDSIQSTDNFVTLYVGVAVRSGSPSLRKPFGGIFTDAGNQLGHAVSSTDFLFNGGAPTNTVNINLFKGTGGTFGARVEKVTFKSLTGLNLDSQTKLNNFMIAESRDPVIPVPVPKEGVQFDGTEDTLGQFDLDVPGTVYVANDVTTPEFSITPPTDGSVSFQGGQSAAAFDGSFDYNPAQDDNGCNSFSFTVREQGGDCEAPAVSASICLDPVNDPPVVLNPTVPVFADSANVVTVTVVTDVDGTITGANLFTLGATIPESGSIRATCGGGILGPSDTLDITNNQVTFCYTTDSSMGEDATDTLSFTVSDGAASSGEGIITFEGQNPFEALNTSFETDEDVNLPIPVSGLGINNVDGAQDDFSIKIRSLPNRGRLLLADEEVTLDTVIANSENLVYEPEENYVSRNGTGVFIDGLQFSLGGCGSITSPGCAITFTYSASSTDGVLDSANTGTATISIDSVNDFGLQVSADSSYKITEGETTILDDLSLTADNGQNIYLLKLSITATEGVKFRVTANKASKVKPARTIQQLIDEVPNAVETGNSCFSGLCDVTLSVVGYRSVLNELLESLAVMAESVDVVEPSVTVILQSIPVPGTQTIKTIELEVVTTAPCFFCVDQNIYIVSGAGGGAVILGLFLLLLRGRSARKRNSAILDSPISEVKEDGRGGLRGRKGEQRQPAPNPNDKKSIRLAVDDEIFDWEKHIDKESGEVYFFNPKTGESQWDPPTVKKYTTSAR